MATSYATFARGGTYIHPVFIRKMLDADGKVLLQDSTAVKKVFEPEPIAELVDIMQDVVNRGTGQAAKLPGRSVAGKTGTADGARDVWFVGFTPDTVTAVWAGNDGDKPIAGKAVTGGSITAGIWRNYMSSLYATHQIASFNFPPPQTPLGQDSQSVGEQLPLQPDGRIPGQPQNDYEAMPPLAPDFRNNRASGWESDKVSKSKKNKVKKPGGFGKFLHKILGAFD
jgi:penicillin-binding protein 1A